jgi:hypothetical protein
MLAPIQIMVYFKNIKTTKQINKETKKSIKNMIAQIKLVRSGKRSTINISDEVDWRSGGSSEADLMETLSWLFSIRFL